MHISSVTRAGHRRVTTLLACAVVCTAAALQLGTSPVGADPAPTQDPAPSTAAPSTAAPSAAAPSSTTTTTAPAPLVAADPGRDVSGQIVGGTLADIADFPWVVGLLSADEPDPFFAQFCAGVRVSQTKVVTAAHCVREGGVTAPAWSVEVYHGSSALSPDSGTRVAVQSIVVHPSFSESSLRNDIAVLTVAAPVTPVATIELITPEAENNTAPGRVARLAGWGCTSVYPAVYGDCVAFPEILRRTDLTIRSTSYCRSSVFGFEPTTMLCAGTVSNAGDTPSACYGDSGGPLTVTGSRGRLVAGLVSFGPGCGGVPSSYTRVAAYRSWLVANGVPMRAAPFVSNSLAPQVNGSYQPLTGDFNGDGHSDIYWYAPGSARDALWLGSPSGPVPGPSTLQVNGTYTPIVGDVDADGDDDLFWYAPGTGKETLWRGDPSGNFTSSPGRSVSGSYVPVVGDFDADGGDDVYWYGVGTAADALWMSAPGDPTSFTSVPARAVNGVFRPAVGDFDGNGSDDVYWYAPGTGADYLWRGSPSGPAPGPSVMQINSTYQLLPGDFDGDGRVDLFGYGAGTAIDLIWRGAAGGFDRQTDVLVNGSYRPATGDLDGDGRDDVLWHGPGSASDSWFAGVNVP